MPIVIDTAQDFIAYLKKEPANTPLYARRWDQALNWPFRQWSRVLLGGTNGGPRNTVWVYPNHHGADVFNRYPPDASILAYELSFLPPTTSIRILTYVNGSFMFPQFSLTTHQGVFSRWIEVIVDNRWAEYAALNSAKEDTK